MKRHIAPVFVAALVAPTLAYAGQYRDLCSSVPGACEYTGPDTPGFDADVCWSPSDRLIAKDEEPCASGSWPYHLDFGEVVDPLSGEIAGYIPLDWACDHPGLCVPGPGPEEDDLQALCCEWGVCVSIFEVLCNSDASVAVICFNGETHEDGTVTCYDGELFP